MTVPDAVAVIGLGCHYPDAATPAELWNTVLGRRRAFRAVPSERLSADYLGDTEDADRSYLRSMAVLEGWQFDRQRYQVPSAVYRTVDLTHWLALQTCAEALADAGFPRAQGLDRQRVAVVIGNSLAGEFTRASQLRYRLPFISKVMLESMSTAGADRATVDRALAAFGSRIRDTFPEPNDETLAGALSNTIAGRICNYFDLGGGGYTIDGACSSSLLAVITACRSLRAQEVDVALAGGVDLSLDPLELIGFARLGALARGPMRVFDADPTGFLPGEGCGVLVLMLAAEARRRGLRCYAELRGWGVSSDGAGGITRPEAAGQLRAMTAAYQLAGLDPADVRFVEGHGTGTPVGDAVELEALNRLRGRAPAALGSIKANIGHTKAAAGAASLIKAVLAVSRRVIPPSTGVRRPHPLMAAELSGLTAPALARPWPSRDTLAAVSSMGFGGINCHLVLAGRSGPVRQRLPRLERDSARRPGWELLALQAADYDALAAQLATVAGRARRWSQAEFEDVAIGTNQDYSGLGAVRCVLIADCPDQLAETAAKAAARLSEPRAGDSLPVLDEGAGFAFGAGRPPRVGLLFPGQAAPVRTKLSSWANGLAVPGFSAGLPVSDGAADTAQAQPAIIRQSLAAAAWLDRAGLQAAGALGHSVGELAALAWCGVLDARSALRVAERRGALMAEHGVRGTGMLAVTADEPTVRSLLAGTGIAIACQNGPLQTVLAGSEAELATAKSALAAAGHEVVRLGVSHGFHSAAIQPAVAPFDAVLAELEFAEPTDLLISTVTGAPVEAAGDVAGLLRRQLVEPVLFATAVRELAARCDLLVEVGPGSTLTGLARDCVDLPVLSCDAGGPERASVLTLAVLAAAGAVTLADWRGRRPFRPRTLEQDIRLLSNPCEIDPGRQSPAPVRLITAPATDRQPAGRPLPGQPVAESGRPEPAPRPEPAGSLPGGGWQSAPSPAGPKPAALDLLRAVLAERAELPADQLEPDCSPLRDLHISSLEVRRCVTQVCAQLDVTAPSSALALSDASLGEIAQLIDGLPSTAEAVTPHAEGVRPWLAAFEHFWTSWSAPAASAATGPVAEFVLTGTDESATPGQLAELLGALSRTSAQRLLIRHRGHPGAAGLARSIAIELPRLGVTVLDETAAGWQGRSGPPAAGPGEFRELRTAGPDRLQRLATRRRVLGPSRPVRFGPGDLLLVTGGAAGVTARCAAELAIRDDCGLVVIGRSPLADPAVSAAVGQLRAAGARVSYEQCDLTDAGAVGTLVGRLGDRGGIAGLVHGAAVNSPAPLAQVSAGSLARAWAPKVTGLRTLLAAAGDSLRLVVGFGSIIGRFGMPGQLDYAVANDGLRVALEGWAADRPACRVRLLEWSVWAELGMGLRMGVLDELRRQGVEPIRPADGVRMFGQLVDDPDAPVTSLVTGRFPLARTANLTSGADQLPAGGHGRFVENPVLHIPAAELVTDSTLSYGDDPYLADHEIERGGVLPAVLLLESFAQAADLLGLPAGPVTFERVALTSPVEVGRDEPAALRVAALRCDPELPAEAADAGWFEAVARCDSDGYTSNRAAARLRVTVGSLAPECAVPAPDLATDQASPLYGPVLFHGGRLRRLRRYDLLTAFRLRAWLQSDPSAKWFSSFHSRTLRLGDPGALDAMLHALLPAVPLRLALPVGCDQVEVAEPADGLLRVDARERSHSTDEFVFDVVLSTPAGRVVSRWSGLRLRAVAERRFDAGLPLPLVGPWLSRLASDAGLAGPLEIVSAAGSRTAGSAAELLETLAGEPVRHTPEGRPIAGGSWLSASYCHSAVLAGSTSRPFGIDWQLPTDLGEDAWSGCLAAPDQRLAARLAELAAQPPPTASAMIWCAREALRKAAGDEGGALSLDRAGPGGSYLLGAGRFSLLTATAKVAGLGQPACAIAVGGGPG